LYQNNTGFPLALSQPESWDGDDGDTGIYYIQVKGIEDSFYNLE